MKFVLDEKGRATTDGVPEYIDENIFDGCKAEVIVLPEGVKTIGEYAFCELENLREIHIPFSVARIEVNAFTDVLNLDRVYITDLAAWCGILFDFESNPFSYADELYLNDERISDLVIPGDVKAIAAEAFVGLRGIRSLTVPDGAMYIGAYAFMFCRNLAEVFISDTVEELAGFVFSGCDSLSKVYLGKNLKRLGVGVFENCGSLKSVNFGGTVSQWFDRFGAFSFEVRCSDGVIPAKITGNDMATACLYGKINKKDFDMDEKIKGVGDNANEIVIWFLTQNEHKVSEGREALKNYPRVRLEQLNVPKYENKDDSLPDTMKEIAISAAVNGAKKYDRMVVAEDAGIFFEAFNDFPGMNTKWIMKKIGYDGIFALLNGKSRKAYFRTVLALAKPDGTYKVFEGIVRGEITDKIYGEGVDCMDYDRIFVPEESDVPFALMMGDKTHMSHRYRAFCKLGEYLSVSEEKK